MALAVLATTNNRHQAHLATQQEASRALRWEGATKQLSNRLQCVCALQLLLRHLSSRWRPPLAH